MPDQLSNNLEKGFDELTPEQLERARQLLREEELKKQQAEAQQFASAHEQAAQSREAGSMAKGELREPTAPSELPSIVIDPLRPPKESQQTPAVEDLNKSLARGDIKILEQDLELIMSGKSAIIKDKTPGDVTEEIAQMLEAQDE